MLCSIAFAPVQGDVLTPVTCTEYALYIYELSKIHDELLKTENAKTLSQFVKSFNIVHISYQILGMLMLIPEKDYYD